MNSYPGRFLFIVFIFLQANAFSQNLDIDILKPINQNETDFKNNYLEPCASSVAIVSVGIPVGLAIAGFINHDQKLKQDALYIGASFLASSIVTQITKHIVNRQRPFETYPFIIRRVEENAWLSFPSGHTSAAFCTATSLALRYRKWYIIAPAYVFATSVAWARMYQGVHYPSDVLAGALVGTVSAWAGWKVQKWMSGKKEQKKKVTL